jgi:trans-aconitate methyltransferase
MEIQDAVRLIRTGVETNTETQRWADLGAGEGTFSTALAHLLKDGSEVYAFDNDVHALSRIPSRVGNSKLFKVSADFIMSDLSVPPLNGILMANSLHFVKDRVGLINKLKAKMATPRFIIVEYERDTSNPWIPYPLNFEGLTELAQQVGFSQVSKLETAPSQYHPGGIYAALMM